MTWGKSALNVRLPDQLHFRKEVPDLELCRLRRIGSVYRVEFDVRPVGRTDGAVVGLRRIGGAHQFPVLFHRIVALQDQHDAGPGRLTPKPRDAAAEWCTRAG